MKLVILDHVIMLGFEINFHIIYQYIHFISSSKSSHPGKGLGPFPNPGIITSHKPLKLQVFFHLFVTVNWLWCIFQIYFSLTFIEKIGKIKIFKISFWSPIIAIGQSKQRPEPLDTMLTLNHLYRLCWSPIIAICRSTLRPGPLNTSQLLTFIEKKIFKISFWFIYVEIVD